MSNVVATNSNSVEGSWFQGFRSQKMNPKTKALGGFNEFLYWALAVITFSASYFIDRKNDVEAVEGDERVEGNHRKIGHIDIMKSRGGFLTKELIDSTFAFLGTTLKEQEEMAFEKPIHMMWKEDRIEKKEVDDYLSHLVKKVVVPYSDLQKRGSVPKKGNKWMLSISVNELASLFLKLRSKLHGDRKMGEAFSASNADAEFQYLLRNFFSGRYGLKQPFRRTNFLANLKSSSDT